MNEKAKIALLLGLLALIVALGIAETPSGPAPDFLAEPRIP